MRTTSFIFILIYYCLGTFLLPQGNFATLQDIPEMYLHCKATEHHDMTPFDFITDHLINIDGLFDKHEQGDEQRPHRPIQLHHIGQPSFTVITSIKVITVPLIASKENIPTLLNQTLSSGFIQGIFHPPIV